MGDARCGQEPLGRGWWGDSVNKGKRRASPWGSDCRLPKATPGPRLWARAPLQNFERRGPRWDCFPRLTWEQTRDWREHRGGKMVAWTRVVEDTGEAVQRCLDVVP